MRNAGPRRGSGNDTLFAAIGEFLHLHGLDPAPAHYSFAHAALTDPTIGAAVARLSDGGVRLSRRDIAALGGSVSARRPIAPLPPPDDSAARLVEQTQKQVDGFADLMSSMRQETTGFGRDLEETAAAIQRQPNIAGLDEIARLTGAMTARIRDTETRLANATAETDALRTKLGEALAQARRDPLTGLFNRLGFEEAFATPVAKGAPRCVAVVDVDHFKRFNDEHGHGVGDRVLSAIGRGLETACKEHLVARYGGEEFAVLMDGIPLVRAAAMLDRAREDLAKRTFRDRETGTPLRRITLSAGVVAVRPGEVLGAVLARADELLYTAKAEGRDRVCTA
ncbi:MAG: hypothetical protein JWN21_1235 [Sphingomonas bacterium]|uniref:GGDEF domain-containing protein n=1 Tax=Sphingomonas bacterium TaxID=1895847 RepID=UPI00262D96C4|nr:GGDEF domain-containing protein [Sphingomonas bacterium]MDB5695692.1 hypothetical protein [Sphingomonas bacterium]